MSDDSRMVKDPICGKDVDTLRARAVGIFGGVTYYFCSADCKAKYVDPRKSAARAAARRRRAAPRDAKPRRRWTQQPVRYARSRIRRMTGEVGSPVVQIDLSPNQEAGAAAPTSAGRRRAR